MFAKIVKIKMIEKDLKSRDLAALMGCSVSNFNQYLRVDNFREESMRAFADLLDCDLEISLTDRKHDDIISS